MFSKANTHPADASILELRKLMPTIETKLPLPSRLAPVAGTRPMRMMRRLVVAVAPPSSVMRPPPTVPSIRTGPEIQSMLDCGNPVAGTVALVLLRLITPPESGAANAIRSPPPGTKAVLGWATQPLAPPTARSRLLAATAMRNVHFGAANTTGLPATSKSAPVSSGKTSSARVSTSRSAADAPKASVAETHAAAAVRRPPDSILMSPPG